MREIIRAESRRMSAASASSSSYDPSALSGRQSSYSSLHISNLADLSTKTIQTNNIVAICVPSDSPEPQYYATTFGATRKRSLFNAERAISRLPARAT